MGDRYILALTCPKCGTFHDEVPYAPTCGWTEFVCPECNHCVDLAEYTGISYEDASNLEEMEQIVAKVEEEWGSKKETE